MVSRPPRCFGFGGGCAQLSLTHLVPTGRYNAQPSHVKKLIAVHSLETLEHDDEEVPVAGGPIAGVDEVEVEKNDKLIQLLLLKVSNLDDKLGDTLGGIEGKLSHGRHYVSIYHWRHCTV